MARAFGVAIPGLVAEYAHQRRTIRSACYQIGKAPTMPRYLISFDDGAMSIPDAELQDVDRAAHAVVDAAKQAGVWIFGGGLQHQRATVVAADGTISDGPDPKSKIAIGGFVILDVASREEAHAWAAQFGAACRCAQEVREILFDPRVGNELNERTPTAHHKSETPR